MCVYKITIKVFGLRKAECRFAVLRIEGQGASRSVKGNLFEVTGDLLSHVTQRFSDRGVARAPADRPCYTAVGGAVLGFSVGGANRRFRAATR